MIHQVPDRAMNPPSGPGWRGMRPGPATSSPSCCPSASESWAPTTPTPWAPAATSPTGPGRQGTLLLPRADHGARVSRFVERYYWPGLPNGTPAAVTDGGGGVDGAPQSRRPARTPELLLSGLLPPCEGFEFGGHLGGLGRAGPLEDLLRLPQRGLRIGQAAVCYRTAA
jgi:hypothetical protein